VSLKRNLYWHDSDFHTTHKSRITNENSNFGRKDFVQFFQNKKRWPKNKSEGATKPPTGAKIIWRGTRRIRGALKHILRNRSFLQCCPFAIYRDHPYNKSQDSPNTSSDQLSSDGVSRENKERNSCTVHCRNGKTHTHTTHCTSHAQTHAWMDFGYVSRKRLWTIQRRPEAQSIRIMLLTNKHYPSHFTLFPYFFEGRLQGSWTRQLLRVTTLSRCGDGLFFEVPPLTSNALPTTLHPIL
jgi:hypothetical protein